ncbi:MAG: MFS transporter [Oscillospiraceae bacterium]|nr:MFS transporter [Oscillospiraceae bacterium]MCI6970181.1 MFS transporter [Oscillospiraceae bacterium]
MEKAKQYFCAKPNGKLHYPHTILTGFGFLASSIAWAIYDPYITKILNHLLNNSATITSWSAKLNAAFPALAEFAAANGENVTTAAGGITLVPLFIGIIMTFDNIFGVIFQPTFGKLSDNTHSRFGKRRPYVIFGAPISAILFAIIPIVAIKVGSLPLTMLFIILFVFVMSLWRAPVVALMPDLTPSDIRSEGNAVINLMGGIGGALGLFAGTIVTAIYCASTGISSKSPEFNELNTFPYVFLLGAAVMVIGMLVILFFVKEPDSRIKVQGEMNRAADAEARRKAEKEAAKAEKEARKKEKLTSGEKRSLIFMLMGLFFLFCGTNAISTFFALFADEILHKTAAQATIMTTAFAAASAIAAIPAGWLGKKFGRKKTILGGLAIFIVAFGAYLLTEILHINALSGALIWVALVVGGAANMFITVNTLPLVLEIGGIDKVGTFTGYYYTATFSAQIATPIIYGIVRMLTGTYMSLFYYCPIAFILSTLCILVVRHGEAIPDEIVEKIKEENED